MTANQDLLMSALDASPFPWQCDLLHRFRQGEAVSSLDIPTGLGKTAVMAVWLVARALGAALPRRLVYVVDRRAVVDQATEVAESLRAWMAKERAVADALDLDDRPLPISTLRGQHVDKQPEPLHLVVCLPMRSLVTQTVQRLRGYFDALRNANFRDVALPEHERARYEHQPT